MVGLPLVSRAVRHFQGILHGPIRSFCKHIPLWCDHGASVFHTISHCLGTFFQWCWPGRTLQVMLAIVGQSEFIRGTMREQRNGSRSTLCLPQAIELLGVLVLVLSLPRGAKVVVVRVPFLLQQQGVDKRV